MSEGVHEAALAVGPLPPAGAPGATADESGDEPVKKESDEEKGDWSPNEGPAPDAWNWGGIGDMPFDASTYASGEADRADISSATLSSHDPRYRHGDADQLLVLTLGQLTTKVTVFHGAPARFQCSDTAITTVLCELTDVNGDLTSWETDTNLMLAVSKAGGGALIRKIRHEWATRPDHLGHAHAFSTPPCGLPVHSIIHTLLPGLGQDPEAAQLTVFHAYRNVTEAAHKQRVRCLAVPIIGGDSVRGDLPIGTFVRAALAAILNFGMDLDEVQVYLCPAHARCP